jgi:hypothetical protein
MGIKGELEMNYGEVLTRAWQIIWRHKILWIFGILAGCGNAGGGGGSNANVSYQQEAPPDVQRYFDQFFASLDTWQIVLIVGSIILVALILLALVIFLGTIGRVGLVRGTLEAEASIERMSFGDLFRQSLPYFWRVFGLNLLFGLVSFIVVILLFLLFLPLVVITIGLAALCFVPLVCILVPLGLFISLIVQQSGIAIVVEDVGIREGLRRGWAVVRDNLGPMILMGLILVIGVFGIGSFIIGLPFLFIISPAVLAAIFQQPGGAGNLLEGGLLVSALCFLGYLPVLLVLSGILRSYYESAWTLTYLRLRGRPQAAVVEAVPS